MALNNLPSGIQPAIQTGKLDLVWEETLSAKLGFREIADREHFPAGIGETLTKSRPGLRPAVTTPLAGYANGGITSNLTSTTFSVEQYTLQVQQYADMAITNVVTSGVAIESVFLKNAKFLAEQAARSVDTLAQQALYNAYLGGNTYVRTTLGSAGTTVAMNDVRGFAAGNVVVVGSSSYTVASVAVDGSNVSVTPGGTSGTITFTTNVTVSDGTLGNAAVATIAPMIFRPNSKTTSYGLASTDTLTIQMILEAKAQLEANNVPTLANGMYRCYADPIHLTGLYQDPAFQQFYRGVPNTPVFRKGVVAELMGVEIVTTNMNPVQTAGALKIRRAAVVGQGALIEGVYTDAGYGLVNGVSDDQLISVSEGIAHITREQIDPLKQEVTSAWSYIGGFVAPTDVQTTSSVLPTASNASLKRGVVLESV